MRLKIAIAADHAGFNLKAEVINIIQNLGHQVDDLGAHNYDPDDDYPDFAKLVGIAVMNKSADRGIIVCGSGVGASVAANKISGIRAAVCHDTYSAHQGVEHDDMNVLCLGGRIIGIELVHEILESFVSAKFSGEERHLRRLGKVIELEKNSKSSDS